LLWLILRINLVKVRMVDGRSLSVVVGTPRGQRVKVLLKTSLLLDLAAQLAFVFHCERADKSSVALVFVNSLHNFLI